MIQHVPSEGTLVMDIYGVKRFQRKIEKAFKKFNIHYKDQDEIDVEEVSQISS